MKLNSLDSSLLNVIDKSQKIMDSLYKLSLTFCPEMIEQYTLVTLRSYKVKKETPDEYDYKHLLEELDKIPFSKLLYEYSVDKWDLFKENLIDINEQWFNDSEYADVVNPVNSDKVNNPNDNKIVNAVYAGFLPSMELVNKESCKYPLPPRIEIHRRYDPEIYTHLMHRNSYWSNTGNWNENPKTRNTSVNEDPINSSIIQGTTTQPYRTGNDYINIASDNWLFEFRNNVRMTIDVDSSIKNLALAFSMAFEVFIREHAEEYNRIIGEIIQSGMFPALTQKSAKHNEVDDDDLIKNELDKLDNYIGLDIKGNRVDWVKHLPINSAYFNIYIYSCMKKYDMDKNYEFMKNLDEAINVGIGKYINSVQISALMTTAAWHNLYGGNPNFYQDFTSRIYNSVLQLNAKEMRLFSKRHAINKENPYVQNRDSISGRTLRNLTHNLHTLLTFLLNCNDKVDYMGIQSNSKKYDIYGIYNKKMSVLVGTLVNRISEFSSVVSNNSKTVVGIKNQKFLVENTIDIGNRALSQITDKGLKIKIQSMLENNDDKFQHTVNERDYLVVQNYMYTAAVFKVVLISLLTYLDTIVSENPNDVDVSYINEDYYQARYKLSKDKLQSALNLLRKNFDRFYDDSPYNYYDSFPLGSLSNSFVVRDSYVNKKDYLRDRMKYNFEKGKLIETVFSEMAKRFNRDYDKWAYFGELKHFASQNYYFIGITSKEDTDLIFQGISDVLDDDLLELHKDRNEIEDFGDKFNVWKENFDTILSANIDIKNIPVNLQNNQLTAMESLDISLNLPLLLQSLENVMYDETADPNKKHKFLENLALLDAAYYNYMKKDIAEYEKR